MSIKWGLATVRLGNIHLQLVRRSKNNIWSLFQVHLCAFVLRSATSDLVFDRLESCCNVMKLKVDLLDGFLISRRKKNSLLLFLRSMTDSAGGSQSHTARARAVSITLGLRWVRILPGRPDWSVTAYFTSFTVVALVNACQSWNTLPANRNNKRTAGLCVVKPCPWLDSAASLILSGEVFEASCGSAICWGCFSAFCRNIGVPRIPT